MRVLGEDDREHAVRLNGVNRTRDGGQVTIDLSAGEYDVVVATGPSYSTKRAEASESMMQFVRAVPGAAALISDLVAKNMDWPGAEQIAERLRRSQPAEVLGEDAATIADPEQLLELQEKSLDMAKTRIETEGKRLANLKAEIEIAEGLAKLQQASTQQANSLAASGRGQDDSVAHLATGEMVVPRELLQGVPGLMEYLIAAFKTQGTDWRRHVVGGPNRINPKTGLAEFMFGRDDFGGDERDGMGGGIGGSDFDGPDDSGGDGGGGSGSGSGLDDFSGPDLGSSYGLGGGIDVSGSGSNHVGGNGVSALSGHPDAELGSPTGTVGGGVMPTQIVDKEHNYFRASPNYAVGLSPDDVPLYDKPVEVAGPFDVGGIGPLTRRNFDTGEIQTGNSSNIGSSIGGFLGGALGGVFGSRKGKPNEGAKGGTIVGEAMGGAVGKLFSNTDYHFPELDPSLQMAPHLEPLSDRLDSQDQNVRMQAVQELNQQRLKEVKRRD